MSPYTEPLLSTAMLRLVSVPHEPTGATASQPAAASHRYAPSDVSAFTFSRVVAMYLPLCEIAVLSPVLIAFMGTTPVFAVHWNTGPPRPKFPTAISPSPLRPPTPVPYPS